MDGAYSFEVGAGDVAALDYPSVTAALTLLLRSERARKRYHGHDQDAGLC
jgi:hypothetical protein